MLNALRTSSDPKTLESVRYSAQAKVEELFPDVQGAPKAMLSAISQLKADSDSRKYLQGLEPYVAPFAPITDKQIQKLFPKNKKLKLPDLSQIDLRYVSYLSWSDIATNKMFIVYEANGQFIGVEGKYSAAQRKGYCFVCNRYEQLVMFSAVSKKKPANASSDYYKAVGNYICSNSDECNKNITEVSALERFIDSVVR